MVHWNLPSPIRHNRDNIYPFGMLPAPSSPPAPGVNANRRYMGMGVTTTSEDEPSADIEPDSVTVEELSFAWNKVATSATPAALKRKLNLRLLRAVYDAEGLGSPGTLTKQQLAEAILKVSKSFPYR